MSSKARSRTAVVPDEAGVPQLPAALRDRAPAPAAPPRPWPVREVEDLHDADFDAELRDHLAPAPATLTSSGWTAESSITGAGTC